MRAVCAVLAALLAVAHANTEIIRVERVDGPACAGEWPVLDAAVPERVFTLDLDAPLWLNLALDDSAWAEYNSFTFRTSIPALTPTDVALEPADCAHGVRVAAQNSGPAPVLTNASVPVHLILEPLVLGVAPQSLLPLAACLPALVLAAWLLADYAVIPVFERTAAAAVEERRRSE